MLFTAYALYVMPAFAATRIVTNTKDSGAGSLRQVIQDAKAGDTIVFSTATFNVPLTITLTGGQIEINKPLTINGIATGVITPTISGANTHRIFYIDIPGSTSPAIINGLNIANGYSDNGNDGGGIYIDTGSALQIRDVTFKDNKTEIANGGAICNNGTLTMTNVVFSNNHNAGNSLNVYAGNGGAIVNWRNMSIHGATFIQNDSFSGGAIANFGRLEMQDVIFTHNIAQGGDGWNEGGAIFNHQGWLTMTNTQFISNTSGLRGGAIASRGPHSQIRATRVVFSDNSANSGGAIANDGDYYWDAATVYLDKVLFTGNTSNDGGAIWDCIGGIVSMANSTLIRNSSNGLGGGISVETSGVLLVTNTTFIENSAQSGGAISIGPWTNDQAIVVNSTIISNSAPYGGAIDTTHGTITLTNTLIAYNECNHPELVVDGGHNLDSANTCGFSTTLHSFIDTNPLLGPTQQYSDPVFTISLLPDSPAIDSGDDTACPTTDALGIHRPIGTHCDIGAYEALPIFTHFRYVPLVCQ
jgi:predicted outer membrane repeat protein